MTDTTEGGHSTVGPACVFTTSAVLDAQTQLDELIASMVQVLASTEGVPAGTRVFADPENIHVRMMADGAIAHTNDIVLELGGLQSRITSADIEALMESGGSVGALLMSRLSQIGAANPMNDAQLIRALLAKLDGEVEFTLEDVGAARKPSTLQYDGLKIKLVRA